MSPDDFLGQSEVLANDADFVLEQFAEWLDQFKSEFFGQSPDVVVAFDGVCTAGETLAGLDDVGVKCALGEEPGVGDVFGCSFEDLDEFVADDTALFLWVGDVAELEQETLGGVNGN